MGMGKVGKSLMGMGRNMGMVSREWEYHFLPTKKITIFVFKMVKTAEDYLI